MAKNKQFYTMKFNSGRLKEFDYDIDITFEEAQEFGEIIAQFDNQTLRSIREINNRQVDYALLYDLHKQKERIKKQPHSEENAKQIKEIDEKINEFLFIPEIITIVMDRPSHYKYLFENDLKVNGNTYKRFSCSAGQARVSTVTFCEENTKVRLDEILDNGRNADKKLVPSKYNAYKGLSTSATIPVSTPSFCVIPDYKSETKVMVNYVTETGLQEDDIIDVREITENFNRFDGQGLISYRMASKWANELGLDYVPAQWCVRQSFCKGMLNTFPIHEFCETKNEGNYKIKTSYSDSNGNPVLADLTEIDVILTESQLKLWDSWGSIEEYRENCEKNNLQWGVSLHSPKKDKDILKMNYQFLQTLNLRKDDIEKVCEKFVDWVSGATSDNVYYTMLFLLGSDLSEDKILHYLDKGENSWVKSLIVNPDLINDNYIKKKVYDLIKNKIKSGCLGEIIVDGNFQTLVSDPYAMMQHVCGLEVTGLLGKKEYYSNYWNQKGVKVVDSMRAPLTYRSEHLLLNLVDNDDVNYWYRYNYTGIIVNAHGHETMNWAGSDFDYDIIATTSDPTIIKGVYKDELPVAYEPPKSTPKVINDDDLYKADVFSFGSAIGSITNKSTSGYALLSKLDESTKEYDVTMNRIKMCTKLQSAQIDKAKIGRSVKGIPKPWINFNKFKEDDSPELVSHKEFLNSILLDKHPYFFIYLYKGTRKKYKAYVDGCNTTCQQRFGVTLDELRNAKRKNKEQREFLATYDRFLPVIDSDCVMNNICKYIESIDFGIRRVVNSDNKLNLYENLVSKNFNVEDIDKDKLKEISKLYKDYKKVINKIISTTSSTNPIKFGYDDIADASMRSQFNTLEKAMLNICSNVSELVNYLIYLHYIEQPKSNKELLWKLYGEYIYENIKNKSDNRAIVPLPDEDGEITYLNKKFKLKEVII